MITDTELLVLQKLYNLIPQYDILHFTEEEIEQLNREYEEGGYKTYCSPLCSFGVLVHKSYFYNTCYPFEDLFYYLIGHLEYEDDEMMANRLYEEYKKELERYKKKYPLYKRLVFIFLCKFKKFFLGESLYYKSFITKIVLKIPFINEWCRKQYL